MRKEKLRGSLRGRRMKTTHRLLALKLAAPDLVERNFASEGPDKLWVADITYVRSHEGFLYLALILDACSRKVVGWSMATHLRTELVIDALQMAIARRKPAPGLVHHSDRGVHSTPPSPSASGWRTRDSSRRWVRWARPTTMLWPSRSSLR
jgi:putative transposase